MHRKPRAFREHIGTAFGRLLAISLLVVCAPDIMIRSALPHRIRPRHGRRAH